ncbi:hypothetical protein KUCAC02_027485, partial [Chaenocephalus aceratus]
YEITCGEVNGIWKLTQDDHPTLARGNPHSLLQSLPSCSPLGLRVTETASVGSQLVRTCTWEQQFTTSVFSWNGRDLGGATSPAQVSLLWGFGLPHTVPPVHHRGACVHRHSHHPLHHSDAPLTPPPPWAPHTPTHWLTDEMLRQ